MLNKSKFLIRLDDASAVMHHERWDNMERILQENSIKPIVAVIPNEKRRGIFYDEVNPKFWQKVRQWQEWGWTIAMHGYTHEMLTDNSGIIGLNKKSEFAGLPLSDQRNRIQKSWETFISHGIKPTVWVAPWHSFDRNTLLALEQETEIRIVSDGFTLRPYIKEGFTWIPCQLRSFLPLPFGTYTLCLHPSMMTDKQIEIFSKQLAHYRGFCISIEQVASAQKAQSMYSPLLGKLAKIIVPRLFR